MELGDTEHVGNRYLELNFSEQARHVEELAAEAEGAHGPPAAPRARPATQTERDGEPAQAEQRFGDGRAEIVEAWFEYERDVPVEVLSVGRRCSFAARVRFHAEVENPLFGINLQNSHRDHLLSASNLHSEPDSGIFKAGDSVVFRVSFDVVFAPGRYHVTPAVASHGGAWIDRRERMLSVMVAGTTGSDALTDLPYELEIERDGSPASALGPTR